MIIKYVPNIYKFSFFAIKYICRYAAGMGQHFQLFNIQKCINRWGFSRYDISIYRLYFFKPMQLLSLSRQILLNLNKVASFKKNSLGILTSNIM